MTSWVGVFEGDAFGFRFGRNELGSQINNAPTHDGRTVRIQFMTRYISIGDGDPYPIAFRAIVFGEADSVQDVITRFWEAAAVLLPPVAVAANGRFGNMTAIAALEISDKTENQILHHIWPAHHVNPRQMKVLPKAGHLLNVISAAMSPDDSAWIHRAALQYATALDYWQPGRELFAVQHAFLAAEVLSRVVVNRQLLLTRYNRDQLARSWGVRRSDLEETVRTALIFNDSTLSATVESISNGFEHGYETIPQLHREAARVRDEACRCVRKAILGVLDLPAETATALAHPNYENPARTDATGSALVGVVTGATAELDDGSCLPMLDVRGVDVHFREESSGGYKIRFSHDAAVHSLPEGLSFRVEHAAYTGPIEDAGIATLDVEGGNG